MLNVGGRVGTRSGANVSAHATTDPFDASLPGCANDIASTAMERIRIRVHAAVTAQGELRWAALRSGDARARRTDLLRGAGYSTRAAIGSTGVHIDAACVARGKS